MTVIVIVACLSIAGAELFVARGARRVSNRLARLEAVTLHQEQRLTALAAQVAETRAAHPAPSRGRPDAHPDAHPNGAAGRPGTALVTDETARLGERMSALEDARRADRDRYARLDGAVDSLERVLADVFRLTVGELDRAAARTLDGIPVPRPGDPTAAGTAGPAGMSATPPRRAYRRGALGARIAPGARLPRTVRALCGAPGGRARPVAIVAVLSAATCLLVGAATLPAGAVFAGAGRFFAGFGGVLALLASTASVITGLAATGRGVLTVRHRILVQAVHRAATFAAVALLASHVLTTLLTGHARAVQLLLPIGAPVAVAIGTVAAQTTLLVAVTGLARGRFAGRRRPGIWRAAHRLAYAGWFLAVLHGLFGGRRPAVWVTWSYVLCVAGVGVALLARGVLGTRSGDARTGGPQGRPERQAGRAREAGARAPR